MTPGEFLREYARKTNTHRFEEVAPLIAPNALYWFTDGSFQGRDAIQQAFERTWAWIQDEDYIIEDVQWLVDEASVAVCTYTFRWRGMVKGSQAQGAGRGTNVLQKIDNQWQITHEHLSSFPQSV